MSGQANIVVERLVAKYGTRTVLEGVDLVVQPGEVRVILGGSGCGKSTLLKHIIGLSQPAGGRVLLLGVDLWSSDEPQREAVLSRIGMLFQGGALLNAMTVHENVALPLQEKSELPAQVIDEMVHMKLALVGLAQAGKLFPPELSGGMKKRAALARAMALDPLVLFCDEPSAGLDPITAASLDELLLSMRDRFGMSLVVVTHELESIKRIADRVTMLDNGRVIADGTLADVQASQDPIVRDFFLRHAVAEAKEHSVFGVFGRGDRA